MLMFTTSLPAGQKTGVPYLTIKELMHPVEKVQASSRRRRELNLMVFMRLGHPPEVITITGSDYEEMPPLQRYFHYDPKKQQPQQYVKLGYLEYIDCLKKAIPKLRQGDPISKGLRSSTPIVVMQDEATPHKAARVAEFCANFSPSPIRLITLPTESPDLTPCDSCFFAVVKNEWRRQTMGTNMSWRDKCLLALELTKGQNPDPFIREVELRWRACQKAEGGHIDSTLRQLKREQGA